MQEIVRQADEALLWAPTWYLVILSGSLSSQVVLLQLGVHWIRLGWGLLIGSQDGFLAAQTLRTGFRSEEMAIQVQLFTKDCDFGSQWKLACAISKFSNDLMLPTYSTESSRGPSTRGCGTEL